MTGELAPRERLADQGDGWCLGTIMLIEKAAPQQRDTHRLAVTGSDRVPKYIVTALRIIILKVSAVGADPARIVAQRQHTGESCNTHTRHFANGLQRLFEKAMPHAVSAAGRGRKIVKFVPCGLHLHREHMLGRKPRINREQSSHASQQKARANHQQECNRDLTNNQPTSYSLPLS